MNRTPSTLLTRFYSLFTLRFCDEDHRHEFVSVHFIVMENLFPPDRDIHEIYDLKVFPYIHT